VTIGATLPLEGASPVSRSWL